MQKTLASILEEIRLRSQSEFEKGEYFEKLVKVFLENDTLQGQTYDKVWLFKDWAKERGLPRAAGHRQGTENLRRIIRASVELGIEILTIYAFSTENWNRPRREVNLLMQILEMVIDRELKELDEEEDMDDMEPTAKDIAANSSIAKLKSKYEEVTKQMKAVVNNYKSAEGAEKDKYVTQLKNL